jgi:hypothetical protein
LESAAFLERSRTKTTSACSSKTAARNLAYVMSQM